MFMLCNSFPVQGMPPLSTGCLHNRCIKQVDAQLKESWVSFMQHQSLLSYKFKVTSIFSARSLNIRLYSVCITFNFGSPLALVLVKSVWVSNYEMYNGTVCMYKHFVASRPRDSLISVFCKTLSTKRLLVYYS